MAFELEIARWVEKAKANADLAFQELALEMARRIVERTPIDTSNARGAWAAGVNARPASGDFLPNDNPMGRIAAVVRTARAGDVIWIVNGVDYAWKLEMGGSDQRPQGMLRVTLLERNAIARDVVAKLPK